MYKLYNEFKSKIEVKAKNAAGIGQEDMQIAELNDYFKSVSTQALPLYVAGKDMGVKVSELAVPDDTPVAETTPKKSDAKKTTKK